MTRGRIKTKAGKSASILNIFQIGNRPKTINVIMSVKVSE